jgi:hypothetical protein
MLGLDAAVSQLPAPGRLANDGINPRRIEAGGQTCRRRTQAFGRMLSFWRTSSIGVSIQAQ